MGFTTHTNVYVWDKPRYQGIALETLMELKKPKSFSYQIRNINSQEPSVWDHKQGTRKFVPNRIFILSEITISITLAPVPFQLCIINDG